MKEFSIPMALTDFVPVLLFAWAGVLMMRDLYGKMSKGAFAIFAAGIIDVTCAGALKALYKLLYAAGICDFAPLSAMFFPVQAIGFLLSGLGLVAMLVYPQGNTQENPQRKTVLHTAALPVFTGTFIFVGMMTAGIGMICVSMSVLAKKLGKPVLIIFFVLALIAMLGMGYLSSHDFTKASMNWIAQGTNIFGQGALLWGTWLMHRAGLEKLELKK